MKKEKGEVKVFVQKDFFNSIITMLSNFVLADETNKYGIHAKKMKDTLLRFSARHVHNNDENAVIYLYKDEAATLIKLFAIYINAIGISSEDFFSQIGKKKKASEKNNAIQNESE